MRLAIFGNDTQSEHLELISKMFNRLRTLGLEACVEESYLTHLKRTIPVAVEGLASLGPADAVDADAAISIGGDGAFLRTAHRVAAKGLPIMGVNAGHLGYLTTVGIGEVGEMLEDLLAGKCRIECRTMLEVSGADGNSLPVAEALNEIAVMRGDTSSMLTIRIAVDGEWLTTYSGDGLLVSTPTGSTAYNLSCGGPILAPTSANIAVTPVSAHSLTMRPVVLPDDVLITVTTTTRGTRYRLSVDGDSLLCAAGTTLNIRKAPYQVKVIQHRNHTFARTLRTKLSWGV